MAELTVPQIDFSSLGNLGQVYQQAQARRTLADLGTQLSNGTVDYTKAAGQLAQSGNLSGTLQLLALAQADKKRKDELAAGKQFSTSLASLYGGAPQAAAPAASPMASGPTVPDDSNALPGTVGMNMRLADLSSDFIQDNPNTSLSSGVRSTADQARLYANRDNNPNPVAPPGSSNHERGLAVDIGGMTPEQRAMLPQYGLAQPVANDPPHVELARNTQIAQAAPQTANDGSELPVNAQPAQGFAVPGQQAAPPSGGLSQRAVQLMSAMSNPNLPASQKELGKQLLANELQNSQLPPIVKEYLYAKSANGFTGSLSDYKAGQTKPKFGIIGEDQMGRKQYGFIDPDGGKVTPYTPPGGQASPDADLSSLHGEEFFSALQKSDPAISTQVRAIVEGRAAYPTGMLLKTPYGQRLAQMVTQADPSFETGNATSRVKVRNEFKAGGVASPAGQISAGNTALQHAGEMSDALERMKEDGGILPSIGSAGIPFVSHMANQLHNKAVQGTPSGAALNDFMTAKNHFSEEVTKFYAGSAGSEAERARALANLDAAKSLPELRSAIKTETNLMQGKVNALQERWRNGMGPLVKDFPLISKESQAAIDRVMKRAGSGDAPKATNTTKSGISWSIE